MKNIIQKLINFVINIGKDKLLHYIACYIIAHIVISVMFAIFTPSYGGCIVGLIAGITIAGIKEIYDYYHPNHTSEFLDFLYGCLGSLTASIVMFISIL